MRRREAVEPRRRQLSNKPFVQRLVYRRYVFSHEPHDGAQYIIRRLTMSSGKTMTLKQIQFGV